MQWSVLKTVFSKFKYLLIAFVVSVSVFSFAVWLPNFSLLSRVLHPDSAGSMIEKADFVLSLYGSIETNFSAVSASYTVAIAILFGVNVALLAYYITRARGGARRDWHLRGRVDLGVALPDVEKSRPLRRAIEGRSCRLISTGGHDCMRVSIQS